jgi:CRP-like cAMP-binding protein
MMWSCVFIDIHATRSWGIVRERQPVEFTGDEQLLYEKTFSSLSPQQFEHLAAIGEWRELDAGHVVHSAGDPPESLEAVVSGQLEARKDGRLLGQSVPGDLVGLASLLGGLPEVYDSTVTRPARVMRWSHRDMEELAGRDESLAAALRKIAGAAISEKLIRLLQAES